MELIERVLERAERSLWREHGGMGRLDLAEQGHHDRARLGQEGEPGCVIALHRGSRRLIKPPEDLHELERSCGGGSRRALYRVGDMACERDRADWAQ